MQNQKISRDESEQNASESSLAVSSVSADFPASSSHPESLSEKTNNVSFVSSDSTCSPLGLQIGLDDGPTPCQRRRQQSPPANVSSY